MVLAVIAGLYWALVKERLVTGAQHRREIDTLNKAAEIVEREHLAALDRVRADAATLALQVREDAAAALKRRDADVDRLYGAWQITDDALNRVTDSRLTAGGEMMQTMLRALEASPLRSQLPHVETPTTDPR